METHKVEGLTRTHLPRLFGAMGLHKVLLLGTHRGEFAYRWLHDQTAAIGSLPGPPDGSQEQVVARPGGLGLVG